MLRAFSLSRGQLVELGTAKLTTEELRASAWIDLQEPTDEERRIVESLNPASLPDADDVDEIESSARYFTDRHGIHVHSAFLYQSEGRTRTATVAFTLQPEQLLTLRDVDVADFRLLR